MARLGKRERAMAKQQSIITANQALFTEQPNDLAAKTVRALGPKANRGGSSRDRLKGGSYGVGFQGPRGFASPKGLVTKREQERGQLAPLPVQPTFGANGSKRHAEDTLWSAETLGYDYATPKPDNAVMVKRGKPGRWRKA